MRYKIVCEYGCGNGYETQYVDEYPTKKDALKALQKTRMSFKNDKSLWVSPLHTPNGHVAFFYCKTKEQKCLSELRYKLVKI